MMNRLTGKGVLLMGVMGLSACGVWSDDGKGASGKPASLVTPAKPEGGGLAEAPADPKMKGQLETCLFEAKQLAKMGGGAYRSQVEAVYRNIQAAKEYATLADGLDDATADTLTPLYQFKVNDACNTVSQSLLGELKKGVATPAALAGRAP
ncbi:TPA: hypothetical protein ACGQS5_004787 [Serratia liquefaciens]